ncbi:MAG TPA: class I SAM-dependent methyltransferase [Pricia sp.]|nr:class I SAM-dependent methyltransferase [Pricia sp.]
MAQQLEARKKSEKKLPTWFGHANIYYPHKLNIEQTSSEVTARYKSQLVSGKSLVDATGGLGVDSYFFSRKINKVFHCEIDENLSEIAAHNFKVLGATNIATIPTDGIQFLKDAQTGFDWIYLDPSRRNELKGKVFRLSDCRPNFLESMPLLFSKTDNILLKTSPFLDISAGIGALQFVKDIHIVAVKNEVKELLWVLEKGYYAEITVKTINFTKDRSGSTEKKGPLIEDSTENIHTGNVDTAPKKAETFDFPLSSAREAVARYSLPLSYLYEPNAAILKSGAFKLLAERHEVYKLHEHTHLYTSSSLIHFPGRRFRVNAVVPYTKKGVKRLHLEKANVATRNFPESVARIRAKHHIGDGGDVFLFFATGCHGRAMLLRCSKIEPFHQNPNF